MWMTLGFQRAAVTAHRGVPAAREGMEDIWNQKQSVLQWAKLANYRLVSRKHTIHKVLFEHQTYETNPLNFLPPKPIAGGIK